MATINRYYQFNSEHKPATLLIAKEWSFDFMRSFKDKHKRENCVLDIATGPGLQDQLGKVD